MWASIYVLVYQQLYQKDMLDFQDQLFVFVFFMGPCLLFGGVPGNPRCFGNIPGGVSTLTALLVRMLKHKMDVIWPRRIAQQRQLLGWVLFVAGILGGGFIFFEFSPLFGEIIQFDQHFSDGLKRPTRTIFTPLDPRKMKHDTFKA